MRERDREDSEKEIQINLPKKIWRKWEFGILRDPIKMNRTSKKRFTHIRN